MIRNTRSWQFNTNSSPVRSMKPNKCSEVQSCIADKAASKQKAALDRYRFMAALRILYFSVGLLSTDELFPGDDLLEAVRHASMQGPHLRAEIWSGERKVAEVGPCPTTRYHGPIG